MQTLQDTLFELPDQEVESPRWGEYATSLSFDERQIIRWIISLHNNGDPFDADVTYSSGRFWEGLPQPRYAFDIAPQFLFVQQADCRHLPFADGELHSIMFDPPFVVAPNDAPGIIRDRFAHYRDIDDLWSFYQDALAEFWRVLAKGGIVAFKCQDIVSSGVNHMTHMAVGWMAQQRGYYIKDLFVLGRGTVLWSPNMRNQQHARKNHSYYLVLQKPTKVSAPQVAVLAREYKRPVSPRRLQEPTGE